MSKAFINTLKSVYGSLPICIVCNKEYVDVPCKNNLDVKKIFLFEDLSEFKTCDNKKCINAYEKMKAFI